MYRMTSRDHRSWQSLVLLFCAALTLSTSGPGLVRAEDTSASPDRKSVVSGKIVDAAKAPVAGAKVTLYRWDSPTGRWGHFRIHGKSLTTDKTGAYRFEGLGDGFYYVSVEAAGFARTLHDAHIDEQKSLEFEVVVQPPSLIALRIEDEEGKPIAGARIREYRLRGVNGELRFPQMFLDSLGVEIGPSNDQGQLQLPALPTGDIVSKLVVVREGYAPVRLGDLKIEAGATAKLVMKPGVNVILRVPPAGEPGHIETAAVDLRYEDFELPSTTIHYEAQFDSQGVARLSLERGSVSWLLLQHKDYFLTPVYVGETGPNKLRIQPGRNQDLSFQVRRKVSARGRVVDAETGKPLVESSIMGELPNDVTTGWDDAPPDKWSFAGWGETNQSGEYTIDLAAGMARVSFQDSELIPEHDHYEFAVAADGSTVIPDIKVRRIPKVAGVVRNPDGTPAVRSVVRLRGKGLGTFQPVLTDGEGRFELQPMFIFIDEKTKQRVFAQDVVAFDPYSPLAGRAVAQLDKPTEVVIKLEPHEPGWPLSAYDESLTDWQRGIVPPEQAAKNASITLHNRPPPELDAIHWINTSSQSFRLADLKGKYVLLDFWHVTCGPCRQDLPSIELVHQLYKDKGVVVIGVHTNDNTPNEVQAHVTNVGLPYPIAVDHPDGRIVASFRAHGIAEGFPNYVLISPEGNVIHDDQTIPSPSLRGYKLELIRKYLLESKALSK